MQAVNPNIDFSIPAEAMLHGVAAAVLEPGDKVVPPDAKRERDPDHHQHLRGHRSDRRRAPAGAMEDAYQRLPGYDRTIVPGTGKTTEQTMVMPIGDNSAMASSVGGCSGIDGLDTWDPSFLGTPIQGMVAVIVGPDYFDRVRRVDHHDDPGRLDNHIARLTQIGSTVTPWCSPTSWRRSLGSEVQMIAGAHWMASATTSASMVEDDLAAPSN